MTINQKSLIRSLVTVASAAVISWAIPTAQAQTPKSGSTEEAEVAKASASNESKSLAASADPVFSDYKGVSIGMSAEEVRNKLGHLKEKGPIQDYFVFSDQESAQVFYDKDGKVSAISIDYVGLNSNPPTPREVLGEDVQAKADGSVYVLRRYPDAGYWVAYNRTAGNDPVFTVTIQKLN